MEKATIFLIIFCFGLITILGFAYYNYDFIKKNEIEYTNLTISAELNGQKIITGYIIETNNITLSGNTSQTYEKIVIEKNQLVKIYNKNLENQNFYQDTKEMNITESIKRITLKLEEPKEIKVNIINKDPIQINLYSEDARDLDFCLSWSLNYIFVKPTNFTKTEKYEKYNDCYDSNLNLKGSNETIEIGYSKFGTPNENDYIKILLINKGIYPYQTQEVKIL